LGFAADRGSDRGFDPATMGCIKTGWRAADQHRRMGPLQMEILE
jgi:hypothetical protein